MGNSGTVLGIIGIILAAGAIGFGIFVWTGQNTIVSDVDDLTDENNNLTNELNDLESEFNNLTQTKVVGIWDALDENLDYAPHDSSNNWLFEFRDSPLNNTNYLSVSNSNTRITLITPGWYRIHLTALYESISASSSYYTIFLEDGSNDNYLDFHETSASPESDYHRVDSSLFVYSNGTKYIEINGYSGFDPFEIFDYQGYNQLAIEYVVV